MLHYCRIRIQQHWIVAVRQQMSGVKCHICSFALAMEEEDNGGNSF
jgi:hypothetical protein